jgi:hypothetical protein
MEISGDFRRPRLCAGTVVPIEGSRLVILTRSPHGVPYVGRLQPTGLRTDADELGPVHQLGESVTAGASRQRRRLLRVDAAYRAWTRNRADVEKLRELHAAIPIAA